MIGDMGVSAEDIERCQNHLKQNKRKRIYQRLELTAEQQDAWRLLGDRLTLLLSAYASSNIVVGQSKHSCPPQGIAA